MKSDRAKRIEGFRQLFDHWDSYDAKRMPEETIQLALRVNAMLSDEWKVIPCAEGPSVWFFRGDEEEIIQVWATEKRCGS